MTTTAAARLVDGLLAHRVDRVFCVPGESYLNVLDALRDSGIATIAARQEGGAAMMAEADAKLTGRPGVCFVTRGPGATNASSGVHVAEQDSTPLVLFVGQVATRMLGRGAFQEVDYQKFFGGMAKRVFQLASGDDVAETVCRAFQIAGDGRPGPVVVALPEDLQGELPAGLPAVEPIVQEPVLPSVEDVAALRQALEDARRPIAIVGGSPLSQKTGPCRSPWRSDASSCLTTIIATMPVTAASASTRASGRGSRLRIWCCCSAPGSRRYPARVISCWNSQRTDSGWCTFMAPKATGFPMPTR
jgi:acetolactate synthase-1/2/3 large subunit